MIPIKDHELYYTWLQSHTELREAVVERGHSCPVEHVASGRRVVLGPREFVFDPNGVCLGVYYGNPDLEAQREMQRFFKAVRDARGEETKG